jgi:hypothetical protein
MLPLTTVVADKKPVDWRGGDGKAPNNEFERNIIKYESLGLTR